jgi:hypothetical protein
MKKRILIQYGNTIVHNFMDLVNYFSLTNFVGCKSCRIRGTKRNLVLI